MIYGPGHDSCGNWTATRGADANHPTEMAMHFAEQAWVLGLVTGMAFARSMLALLDGAEFYAKALAQKPTDYNAITLWMDQYCAAHPLEQVHQAAQTLFLELSR